MQPLIFLLSTLLVVFLCMQLKENAPFHLEEAVNSLSRFMSSQKCSETTGSPRYSYRHYYKESLLGTAVRALFQLRHLYDCTKKAITEFCTESIVATIASVIDAN